MEFTCQHSPNPNALSHVMCSRSWLKYLVDYCKGLQEILKTYPNEIEKDVQGKNGYCCPTVHFAGRCYVPEQIAGNWRREFYYKEAGLRIELKQNVGNHICGSPLSLFLGEPTAHQCGGGAFAWMTERDLEFQRNHVHKDDFLLIGTTLQEWEDRIRKNVFQNVSSLSMHIPLLHDKLVNYKRFTRRMTDEYQEIHYQWLEVVETSCHHGIYFELQKFKQDVTDKQLAKQERAREERVFKTPKKGKVIHSQLERILQTPVQSPVQLSAAAPPQVERKVTRDLF